MTDHKTGTREEWLAARLELLEAEKALTRRSDELARWRQELPWVRVDKEYRFDTEQGRRPSPISSRDARSSLVYHFMFGPDYERRVPVLLGDRGRLRRLGRPPRAPRRHALRRVAGAAREAAGYRERMGWSFPWASSDDSDFNYDFQVTHTEQEWEPGAVDYNFRSMDFRPPAGEESPWSRPVRGERRDRLEDLPARGARRERVRARGRRRVPHLLGVRTRDRRPLGHVPVARPRAARAQRDRPLVAPPRRVRGSGGRALAGAGLAEARPRGRARSPAARSATCSLVKMFETWLRTVFGLSTKCARDPRVVAPLGDQLEHLALAVGQLGERARGVLGRGA